MIGDKKYKVISFDLFDTLLVRPCMQPTDILRLVGLRCGFKGSYLEMRRAAEKAARKNADFEEIQYDEIYCNFKKLFDVDAKLVEKFKATELEIEEQYLSARRSLKEIYDFACSLDKEIIIVSDIYLPKTFIEKILLRNGFAGYHKIYLSSEYRVMKSSGNLYKTVLADLETEGITPSQILHMGDNEKSDVAIPKTFGIKTIHIPRTNYLVRKNRKLKSLYDNIERRLDNSLIIGFAVNRTFDDPFRFYHPDTFFYGSKFSISNMLFGPFFFSFVKWMYEDCIREKVNTLCLVYRDGYIPEKIIDCISPYYDNIPEIRRLYLTRALINYSYGADEDGLLESINDMLYSDNMTVSEFIKNRLFASGKQYNKILNIFMRHGYKSEDSKVGRRQDFELWIKELYPYFKENTAYASQIVKEYCQQVLSMSGKTAVYDVGYRGSVCKYLKERLDIDTYGYHLFAKDSIRKRNVNVKYPIMYGLKTEKECMLVNCLTEDMLNSREASVKGIVKTKAGNFRFVRDENYKEDGRIEILQDYVVEFAKDFSTLFGDDLFRLDFDISHLFEFYCDFLKNATAIDTRIFRRMDMIDSTFMNPFAKNIYREWELKHRFKSVQDRIEWQMKESVWNVGVKTQYRIKPTIVVAGNPKHIDKKVIDQLVKHRESNSEVSIRLLMESSEHSIEEYYRLFGKWSVDLIERVDLPRGYDAKIEIKQTSWMKELIAEHPYLAELALELDAKFRDMGNGYSELLVCYWYLYFRKIVNVYNQEKAKLGFYIWDEKSTMHKVLSYICDLEHIPCVYTYELNMDDLDSLSRKITALGLKCKKKKHIRVGVYASMPRKGYSGGRTHALNLAECLSHEGDEVFFISKYLPMFLHEMNDNPGHSKIHYVCSDDLISDEAYYNNFGQLNLDYLIVVPHKDKDEGYYINARGLAIRMNAKLILLNYETPNWMNEYLPQKQDEECWEQWRKVTTDGCMVLCSDKESMKYAKAYYKDNPTHTRFDYWYPTVNSIVADKTSADKENQIIAFVRPGAVWKGTDDIFKILDDKIAGYKVVLISGYGVKDKLLYDLIDKINTISEKYNIDIKLLIQPSDEVKFTEIRRSKVMLFPSYFEGYGTPPIEAQYCNTTCLVYDLPVLRETCGKGVVYCKHGDFNDMKKKLLSIIKKDASSENLHDAIYDIANFDRCSKRLHDMLLSHMDDEWRYNWRNEY